MLKKYFTLLFLLLVTQALLSQVNYGLKFGMNYSIVSVDISSYEDIINYNNYKFGFHIGLVTNIPITTKFSVNAELLYSDKGSSNKNYKKDEYYEFNLYYIDFPITLNYYLLNKKLAIQLGVEPGYLSSQNFADYFEEGIVDYNSFDLEILAGVEYYLNKVGIGLRYQNSIIPILEYESFSEEGKSLGSSKSYNKNIQLYFTYLIKSK